jgi:CheY-like chemotaxis protein
MPQDHPMTSLRHGHPDARADRRPADARLRLVVVDADDRTRETLVGLLGLRARFQVVASSGDADGALRAIRTHRPDVVILDPRLPERGGASLIRSMRALEPGSRLVVASRSAELEHELIDAGADAFIRKTFRPSELADAIEQCMGADRRPAPGHPGESPLQVDRPAPAVHEARRVAGTGTALV